MQWTIDFNQLILAVYVLSAAIAVLSLLMVCVVMWMRSRARARDNRLAAFRATWYKLLQPHAGEPGLLPRVSGSEMPTFMAMWNRAHGSPGAAEYLNTVARRLQIDAFAVRALRKRDVALRLQAIELLGNLGDMMAVPALRAFLGSQNAVLSFAAARALLRIDPRFSDEFVVLLSERRDWSPAKLQAVVQEEQALLASPVIDFVRLSPPPVSRSLVQYLRFFDPKRSLPVLRYLLENVTDSDALTACLKVLTAIGSRPDCALAAKLLAHEDWRVRVQAANAVAKLGDASDVPMLAKLLDDSHWWVRYRAAQALTKLSGEDGTLRSVLANTQDRYGRDMLTQVMAERQPLLQGGTP